MKQVLAGTRPKQRAEAYLDGAINFWQQNVHIMGTILKESMNTCGVTAPNVRLLTCCYEEQSPGFQPPQALN